MRPVKNRHCPAQYKGICSGLIYTLVKYLPCNKTELLEKCMEAPCTRCQAEVSYQSEGQEKYTQFETRGIKGWRINDETC